MRRRGYITPPKAEKEAEKPKKTVKTVKKAVEKVDGGQENETAKQKSV